MINREIKFRAWDGDSMRQVYQMAFKKNGVVVLRDDKLNEISGHPPMQFTGLHDKHGTEIYEGDIVKHDDYSSGAQFGKAQPHRLSLVVFHNGGFVLDGYGHIKTHQETHEVVGNIYESGDLLTDDRGEMG